MGGVDVIEMDFQLTSDDKLVTMHDDSVDRTTNGTGLVREMDLEQIQNLDASTNFLIFMAIIHGLILTYHLNHRASIG